jgi:hypothetical protein
LPQRCDQRRHGCKRSVFMELMEVVALAGEQDPFEFSKAIVHGDKCQYYFRMRSTK